MNESNLLSGFLSEILKQEGDFIDIEVLREVIEAEPEKSKVGLFQVDIERFKLVLELEGWKGFKNAYIRGSFEHPDIIVINDEWFGNREIVLLTSNFPADFSEIRECKHLKEPSKEIVLTSTADIMVGTKRLINPVKFPETLETRFLTCTASGLNTSESLIVPVEVEHTSYSSIIFRTLISTSYPDIILLLRWYDTCLPSRMYGVHPNALIITLTAIKLRETDVTMEQLDDDIEKILGGYLKDLKVDATFSGFSGRDVIIKAPVIPTSLVKLEPVNSEPIKPTIKEPQPKLTFCEKVANFFTN